ncbi:FAD-dependent oxidoreductase [Proteiniclasticum sp. C24MP]|uniref:FAD-dependent oxidoreductase n=1 Tax=Proteiniclasticum sp. C24MP TaxID=3374101 RepID=UPI0037541249
MHVAIIGGGFSGLTAAYLLEKKGISVTVYEKEASLGGHCQTVKQKALPVEMGTAFCFSESIQELLLSLNVPYTERFTYRHFLDENHQKTEHLSPMEVPLLLEELERLKSILASYFIPAESTDYFISKELMIPLGEFLRNHNLKYISAVMTPYLSSYGFGNSEEIMAYYAFNILNLTTIHSFIRGDKLLFINEGVSEIIRKLSEQISDIRYNADVREILPGNGKVKITTAYEETDYDKVLLAAMLPPDILKDGFLSDFMNKLECNPYVSCAYEVADRNIATTYYRCNFDEKERIQFFHTHKEKDKTVIVAYAYGNLHDALIKGITEDIRKSGVKIRHLITARQWQIFPHISPQHQKEDLYGELKAYQKTSDIHFIGSLVSKPALSSLYASVKKFVNETF